MPGSAAAGAGFAAGASYGADSAESSTGEYLVAPLGLDEPAPRLSWAIESERRGTHQTAFRIRVSSSAEKLARGEADRWDSGRVEGGQTTHVAYAGRPLVSRDACHWCVEVWDDAGKSARSAPSSWTMGFLDATDWTAGWIAGDPEFISRDPQAIAPTLIDPGTPALFRREFDLGGPVERATLYASARGLFELRANGQRVGSDTFAPEWTDYHKRIQYHTYDVTALLGRGRNALAATLGDGWWSGYVGWQETRGRYGSLENSLVLQLEVELVGGQRFTLGTDRTWTCNSGPILASDFMMGETCDARRERIGWDGAGFTGREWLAAREVAAPLAPLVAQRSEPVRVVETLEPVSVNQIQPGVFIFDLGQNIAGWVRLHVNAPAGTRITLRHGERLDPEGTLYTENLRRAMATDVYVCKGGGEETWQPHFTFHGFQYVELTGHPAVPGRNAFTGCIVRSATPHAGEFECSHAGVNRLCRIAFLRRILADGPAGGLDPVDKWQNWSMAGQPGDYYLLYFGHEAPKSWPLVLFRAGLTDGMQFKAEVIDTWAMTLTPRIRYAGGAAADAAITVPVEP